jgi:hypothetical protein
LSNNKFLSHKGNDDDDSNNNKFLSHKENDDEDDTWNSKSPVVRQSVVKGPKQRILMSVV